MPEVSPPQELNPPKPAQPGLGALQHVQRIFQYRAKDRHTGRVVTGEQQGQDAYSVRAALRRIDLEVEWMEECQPDGVQHPLFASFRRALQARKRRQRRTQRAEFFEALATMLDAGLPLDQALASLGAGLHRPRAERQLLAMLRDDIRAGVTFADACRRHPQWFDALDTAMLSAGQAGGMLSPVLRSLGELHQRADALGGKLFTALAYPVLLLLVACGVALFLGQRTLPALAAMLENAHQSVPFLTRVVIGFSNFVVHYGIIVIPLLLVSVFLFWKLLQRHPAFLPLRRWIGGTFIARIVRRHRVADLSLTLARLLRSGLPLVEALSVCAQAADSKSLSALMTKAHQDIRSGRDFSGIMAESDLLEPEFAQLLRLGETSGELPSMLERISQHSRRAADRSLTRFTTLLEPLTILCLAVLVGLLVFAAIQPLLLMGKTL